MFCAFKVPCVGVLGVFTSLKVLKRHIIWVYKVKMSVIVSRIEENRQKRVRNSREIRILPLELVFFWIVCSFILNKKMIVLSNIITPEWMIDTAPEFW